MLKFAQLFQTIVMHGADLHCIYRIKEETPSLRCLLIFYTSEFHAHSRYSAIVQILWADSFSSELLLHVPILLLFIFVAVPQEYDGILYRTRCTRF